MITSVFGVVSALEQRPAAGDVSSSPPAACSVSSPSPGSASSLEFAVAQREEQDEQGGT
jgi:hypothetical protein